MITVKPKEIGWILDRLAPYRKIVVVGCGTCATVCFGGGEREVEELCCSLQLAVGNSEADVEFQGLTCERVCDWEFVEPVAETLQNADAILSLACGAGTNLLAEKLAKVPVIPGVDTVLLGTNTGPGVWLEKCAACGDCIIDQTFGICPIAGCAKTLLNGPCGGSSDGKCEVNPDVDCAWAKIIERAKALGRLEELERLIPPKDWSAARHGGQRSLDRSDLGIQRLSGEDSDEI